jgi:hypothetical protein
VFLGAPDRTAVHDTKIAFFYLSALKNADTMLRKIFRSVDTNGDGFIEYSGKITRHFIVINPRYSDGWSRLVI